MKKLKIDGHAVVFGTTHKQVRYVGYSDLATVYVRQAWRIPTLELRGFVDISVDGTPYSLDYIVGGIKYEVKIDLDNRRKRELGIAI